MGRFIRQINAPAHTIFCIDSNGSLSTGATFGGATISNANQAFYWPIKIKSPVIAAKMKIWNMATAAGNVDAGIYNAAGTKLASTGSTALSATEAQVVIALTASTLLTPGIYYLAVAYSSATHTTMCALAAKEFGVSMGGVHAQSTAFPLPATATFAAVPNSTNIPLIALTSEAL